MRLMEIADVLQLRHHVAHHRRANPKMVMLGYLMRADRLGVGDELLNRRQQQTFLSLRQILGRRFVTHFAGLTGASRAQDQLWYASPRRFKGHRRTASKV